MTHQSHFERAPRKLRRQNDRRWWIRLGIDYIITRVLIVALMALAAGQLYRIGQHGGPVALKAAKPAAEKVLREASPSTEDGARTDRRAVAPPTA